LVVIRTLRAEEDLIEVWTHIASDDPRAADRVLDELERKTMLLARYPEIGRERPDIAPGLRYLASGNYLILYRLAPDSVEIVRYVHGSRDLKEMISRRDR
jgi:toxin ParE1/3/4